MRNNKKEVSSKEPIGVRLNKYIADAGVCSRREADKLIAAGDISVNGKVVVEMGFKVQGGDVVKYKRKTLSRQRFKYFILNKPKDCITTADDPHGRRTVMDIMEGACSERIYPVGRLDRNTTGLLILTNDGHLAKRLTHPSYNVMKTYHVELDKGVTGEDLKKLQKGVELEDGWSKFDKADYGNKGNNQKVVIVTLHSGKNRIVRRMFEHVGYEVKKLDRIAFAGIKKDMITRGKYRELTKKEVGFLKMTSKNSAKK
ncbi:MAG: rRNA pseudouridine synthase [Flavobacteriales bacterium]|jgi:23S rRNA pseudouridine2605 synthase|nr:rRNA pseudouridine synthase [Flavobacteriales bacterium]